MLWMLVLGLLVWATFLSFRVSDLKQRIHWLERRLQELREQFEARAPSAPELHTGPEPTAPSPAARPRRSTTLAEQVAVVRAEAPESAVAAPIKPRKPAGPPPRELARAWLEENGLAWAGGAALALGGLFLVTYAAQRGLFTPSLRIASAVVTGLVLLAASEWLKRRSEHPLAAAMAAGAGAATIYGAVWASYWLYAFIGLPVAGGVMAMISLGVLAMAFRHGEPLAILAILGGFLAPAITGPEQWTAPALTGFLLLITVTGYAVVAVRRWGQAGMATLLGAVAWAFAGFSAQGYDRVAALALAPVVLSALAVEWRRRRGEPPIDGAGPGVFTLLPAAALVAGAVALAILWPADARVAFYPAVVGAGALAILSAVAARRRLIPPLLQVVGYAPALGFLIAYAARQPDPATREAWGAALVLALATAGVWASMGRDNLRLRLGGAAAGFVALVLILGLSGPVTEGAPWIPAAAGALLLLAGAIVLARSSGDPARDLPLAIWLWAAGAAGLFAIDAAFQDVATPPVAACLALAAAFLHARLGWRGFAAVSVAAALAAMAALMSTGLFGQLVGLEIRWWLYGLSAAAAAGLAWLGARVADHPDRPKASAEALGTAALLVGLTGASVLLRLAAARGPAGGAGLDLFLEAGLRTVLLLAAGLTSAQAVRGDSSLIGRWRGQVLLSAGIAHGAAFCVLGFNPLWASWTPAVAGPRILDSLAVSFLVPAGLLVIATWPKVAIHRMLLVLYGAAAFGFGLVWMLMETRRLFQGASLHAGFDVIGRAEAAAYAVLGLAVARGVIWLGEQAAARVWTGSEFAGPVVRLGRLGAWAALLVALFVFGYGASPWWGPIDRPLAGWRATALLLSLYVAGGGLAFELATSAARAEILLLARAARAMVVGIAFALLSLTIRLAFRGYDMRPNLQEASLETWAFSAAWGLYGFGLLVYGAARRSTDLRGAGLVVLVLTLAKIFLFDMSRLDGIVRAASFLAVGALLLGAAVIVRRLGGTGGLLGGRPPTASGPT